MAGARPDLIIVPFRGEYYELVPERQHLVKGLIYPVPDPRLPFLGVHFTCKIQGGVEAGPNAVLAFKREGYRKIDFSLADTLTTLTYPGFWRMAKKYWHSGLDELFHSLSKKRRFFVRCSASCPNFAKNTSKRAALGFVPRLWIAPVRWWMISALFKPIT